MTSDGMVGQLPQMEWLVNDIRWNVVITVYRHFLQNNFTAIMQLSV
jgi:hypothetical protein